ncbi:MAG: ADP-forming succinate--CoA ligase subunit beta [Caldilineaceae bacterium]|nr:ADP-forming succinate--CoA ligase subunit beta [Caldilineaceae bacterium]
MNLHEYQTKSLLEREGIPVPQGAVAMTPDGARQIAIDLGLVVAVKAQVLTGGRGKAGGIRLAGNPDEAEDAAAHILGMDIKGHKVQRVLVEQASHIKAELYLAALIDRTSQQIMVMASSEGGMEIEEVAAHSPDKIRRIYADPFMGIRSYQCTRLAREVELPVALWPAFHRLVSKLHDALIKHDADLLEINPLVVNHGDQLVALDGKMTLDDNALYRQPEFGSELGSENQHPTEVEALNAGLNFVYLGGNVACLANGAGLAMATMDAVKYYGGDPANFLDLGGGSSVEQVTQAVRIMVRDPGVRALLVNVAGGITRCDEVAEGIAAAMDESETRIPFVVRLVGTNEAEAHRILEPYDVEFASRFSEAAMRVVELARESTA